MIGIFVLEALDSLLKRLAKNPTFYSLFRKLASMVMYYRGPRVSERIVEYPFVFESLKDLPRGAKILDVGCTPSILSVELAAFGYEVWGLDLLEYPSSHPNFTFIKGSIIASPFLDEFFDAVTCVSTLEHIGLYGFLYPSTDMDGDKNAMKEIARVTKRGGKIVVTIPYGISITSATGRVYDGKRLNKVMEGLKIDDFKTYMYKGGKWCLCTEEEVSKVPSYSGVTLAVACLRLIARA